LAVHEIIEFIRIHLVTCGESPGKYVNVTAHNMRITFSKYVQNALNNTHLIDKLYGHTIPYKCTVTT
jgi:hypothetical protein